MKIIDLIWQCCFILKYRLCSYTHLKNWSNSPVLCSWSFGFSLFTCWIYKTTLRANLTYSCLRFFKICPCKVCFCLLPANLTIQHLLFLTRPKQHALDWHSHIVFAVWLVFFFFYPEIEGACFIHYNSLYDFDDVNLKTIQQK